MAWIEAHQELRNHPKTKKAARLLGVSRPQLIGHLFCLWWWCLDYSANGNLAAFDNADIADGAEWDGDPDRFVQSLIECGPSDRPGFLVDNGNGLEVKDWCDYGGKYITKRDQGRERQRNFRIKKRFSNADVTDGNVSVTDSNALLTRHTSVSNAPTGDMSRVENSIEQDIEEVAPHTAPAQQAPPPTKTPADQKPKPASKPVREDGTTQQAMFGKIAEICDMDADALTGAVKSQIGGAAKQLIAAGATADRLTQFRQWWDRTDWRGKKHQAPTPPQIVVEWPKFSANGNKTGNAALDTMIREGLWQPGQPL